MEISNNYVALIIKILLEKNIKFVLFMCFISAPELFSELCTSNVSLQILLQKDYDWLLNRKKLRYISPIEEIQKSKAISPPKIINNLVMESSYSEIPYR